MNQLVLSPPLLIVVMGLPGSGKTFFGRQFSDEHSLPYISEDRVRFELFEKPQFSPDETVIIDRMLMVSLEQLVRTKVSIVVEGDFLNAKLRKEFSEAAQKLGYRTLTVWIQTDAETSLSRASKRDRRSVDNKFAAEMPAEIFEKLKDRLQRPTEKEVSVVISGKHAYKSQSLTVLKKITGLYSGVLADELAKMPARSYNTRRVVPPRRMIQ